jgi:flagellin-like hook-associated protein FlgL
VKIGTNITASIATQSLAKNERGMAQSMQRLSTGLSINSAADDAAGLAIASRMTSQVRGLDQAVHNANDAIGMIQTADGAIASVTELLQRMRELSVQAASDTNTTKDRSSLDLEYQTLKAEIERVFSNTQWNGENLLDGSHFGSTTSLQVGASASQTIDISLGNFSINRLGGTSTQTGYVTHASAPPTLSQTTAPASSETLNTTGAWTQRGADIDGEATGDMSGAGLFMSSDGNTIAIGADHNDDGGSNSGHVRIFDWDGSSWTQRGSDIPGEATNNNSGGPGSIGLSEDKNTLVIGAHYNGGNGAFSGHVRVFHWNGASWVQRGSDIDSEAAGDTFGDAVAISDDGETIVVGAPENDGTGNRAGHVRIFDWDGAAWTQRGADIDGEAAGDKSGESVTMSSDGNSIAIGATANAGNGNNSGQVRVYFWNGSAWEQRGSDIDGEAAWDQSGYSVSMSSDGSRVAISARGNDGNGTSSGHVRVYSWNGSAWIQLGSDIEGEKAMDASGDSISLNDDGDILAIGAAYAYAPGGGSSSGHVRLFKWDGNAWAQLGNDIDAEALADNNGSSVSISATGGTVAISAPSNDGNGNNAGHVRIFDWPTTTTYSAAVSKLDFSNLNLVAGDRITINVTGGTLVQGIIGAEGLDALLTTMASQIAGQTGLYGGALASSGVISITGLADGNSVSGLSVTLEKNADNYADSVSPTSITTAALAATALVVIDRATTQINSQRGTYGAVMNRLEYAIDNLTTMATNVRVSLSRIQDADYAKETTELARTQIIQQAATAMLAQANQQAKIVMEILNWDK